MHAHTHMCALEHVNAGCVQTHPHAHVHPFVHPWHRHFCTRVHGYTHAHTQRHTCARAHERTHVQTCTYIYMHMCIHRHMVTHLHVHSPTCCSTVLQARTCTHMCLHTHVPTHMNTYVAVHTCTYGHIWLPWVLSHHWWNGEWETDAAPSPHCATDAVPTQDGGASHSCTSVTLVPTPQRHPGTSPRTPLGGLSCAVPWGWAWGGPCVGQGAVSRAGRSERRAGVIKMCCLFYLSTTVRESYRALS